MPGLICESGAAGSICAASRRICSPSCAAAPRRRASRATARPARRRVCLSCVPGSMPVAWRDLHGPATPSRALNCPAHGTTPRTPRPVWHSCAPCPHPTACHRNGYPIHQPAQVAPATGPIQAVTTTLPAWFPSAAHPLTRFNDAQSTLRGRIQQHADVAGQRGSIHARGRLQLDTIGGNPACAVCLLSRQQQAEEWHPSEGCQTGIRRAGDDRQDGRGGGVIVYRGIKEFTTNLREMRAGESRSGRTTAHPCCCCTQGGADHLYRPSQPAGGIAREPGIDLHNRILRAIGRPQATHRQQYAGGQSKSKQDSCKRASSLHGSHHTSPRMPGTVHGRYCWPIPGAGRRRCDRHKAAC